MNNNHSTKMLNHILKIETQVNDIANQLKNINEIKTQMKILMDKINELELVDNEDENENDIEEELTEEEYIAELENLLELSQKEIRIQKREAKRNKISYAEWLYMLHEDEKSNDSEKDEDEEEEEEEKEDDY